MWRSACLEALGHIQYCGKGVTIALMSANDALPQIILPIIL
jgi:hypothetical protein